VCDSCAVRDCSSAEVVGQARVTERALTSLYPGSPLALEQRRWRSELAALSEPPPAAFVEVGAFERPQREVCGARQHYADIVCGVEFTADGRLLACAGVAKQVCCEAAPLVTRQHATVFAWNAPNLLRVCTEWFCVPVWTAACWVVMTCVSETHIRLVGLYDVQPAGGQC